MTSEYKQVKAAYAELEAARLAFHNAIDKFKSVYDTENVGLEDLQESLLDVMYDIECEIEANFGEAE